MTAQVHPKLAALLRDAADLGASDLHLAVGSAPRVRTAGLLRAVPAADALTPGDLSELAAPLLDDRRRRALDARGSVDAAVDVEGAGRFRVNVFGERGGLAIACRRLEDRLRTLEDLGLPAQLRHLADLADGLVLVTGPTGSGKSTTLATLLHQIVTTRDCHVLTLEDPIEYVHPHARSLVRQRELHTHFDTFADAVRDGLREDPDVILVGEMRDAETMRAAISAAETGHLVFSTLHSRDAVGALDRMIGAFDRGEQDGLRQQLSTTLRAVVGQRLMPRCAGGRVPLVEVLHVTTAVAHLVREFRPQQIHSAMESGVGEGMILRDHALAVLVARGEISIDTARPLVRDGSGFERRVREVRGGTLAAWGR